MGIRVYGIKAENYDYIDYFDDGKYHINTDYYYEIIKELEKLDDDIQFYVTGSDKYESFTGLFKVAAYDKISKETLDRICPDYSIEDIEGIYCHNSLREHRISLRYILEQLNKSTKHYPQALFEQY